MDIYRDIWVDYRILDFGRIRGKVSSLVLDVLRLMVKVQLKKRRVRGWTLYRTGRWKLRNVSLDQE
jgi:hypothetical protein